MKRYIGLVIAACLLSGCVGGKEKRLLVGNWIEVMPANPQITQGVTLRADGSATSIGMATLLYERWETQDDQLILWGKSVGNGQTIDFSDTLRVVKVTPDSLLLDKYGMYRVSYYKVASVGQVEPFNVLDSLDAVEGLTELQTRNYSGLIPDASGTELPCTLTIYNYKHCGDGVWQLTRSYPAAQGGQQVESFGRMYTLRGDAENRDAVVYQLIPFAGGTELFFRYQGETLELLNQKLERLTAASTTVPFVLSLS